MRNPICNFPGCRQCATVAIPIARRGGRNAYMCDFHAHGMASYSSDNNKKQGKNKVSQDTFGTEFEASYSDTIARAEMIAAKYLPTYDCTVNVEYKSPIYNGLNSLSKTFNTFDKLIAAGHLTVGEGCGSHFHYGNKEYINAETMGYIRRFYHSLFIPLCEKMQSESTMTELFWGA